MPAALVPRRTAGVAAVVGASAAWGLGTALSKGVIDDDVAPSLLLALQLLTASTILGVAALVTGGRRSILGPGWLRLAATGVIEPGVSAQLYTLGLSLTAASTATIIFSTEPAMVVLMAWVFLAERPSWRLAALCGLTLLGVVLVVVPDGGGGAPDSMTGVALVAAGTFGAVVRGMIASRQVRRTAPLPLAFLHHVAGFVVAGIVVTVQLLVRADLETPGSTGVWLTAAASGLIQYALPFWLYLVGLRHLRVGVATQFLALIPVFGVGFSVLLLGETFAGWQLVGGATVLVALVGVTRLEAREHGATLAVPPWGDPEP